MRVIFYVLFVFIVFLQLFGCNNRVPERNAELTVTYFGKEVYKENPTWSNKARIKKVIAEGRGKKYIIFGASWCKSCSLLRKALRQGEILQKVEFINVNEEWVNFLAKYYGITSIPTMLMLDEKANIEDIISGPSAIVMKLLINIK